MKDRIATFFRTLVLFFPIVSLVVTIMNSNKLDLDMLFVIFIIWGYMFFSKENLNNNATTPKSEEASTHK